MLNKRAVVVVVALCCLFALSPSALFSQSTGTVNGLVTDPSGAAVAGATVTLTDTATAAARTALTNEAGRYAYVSVPPGVYNLTDGLPRFEVDGSKGNCGDRAHSQCHHGARLRR